MTERLGWPLRPIGMRSAALGVSLLAALVLSGCGDDGSPAGEHTAPPSTGCTPTMVPSGVEVRLDLDGDGATEPVRYTRSQVGDCPEEAAALTIGEHLKGSVPIDVSARLTQSDVAAVELPGRTGQVLLVEQHHPRGGFQAHLYGYADGAFEELEAEGKPVFDFIATDVLTTPTEVECAADGFTMTQARAHEPIGVVPAWDVDRTTYSVDGNTVTKGATSEIADNVLDAALQRQYGDLTDYPFFENCRVAQ